MFTFLYIYFSMKEFNPTENLLHLGLLGFRDVTEFGIDLQLVPPNHFLLMDAHGPARSRVPEFIWKLISRSKGAFLMTEYKWGLVEDGEKDEKLGSPRIFLAVKAIHNSDMVLGRRKEEFGVNSGAESPRFDSRQETFKEKQELHTPAHTQ